MKNIEKMKGFFVNFAKKGAGIALLATIIGSTALGAVACETPVDGVTKPKADEEYGYGVFYDKKHNNLVCNVDPSWTKYGEIHRPLIKSQEYIAESLGIALKNELIDPQVLDGSVHNMKKERYIDNIINQEWSVAIIKTFCGRKEEINAFNNAVTLLNRKVITQEQRSEGNARLIALCKEFGYDIDVNNLEAEIGVLKNSIIKQSQPYEGVNTKNITKSLLQHCENVAEFTAFVQDLRALGFEVISTQDVYKRWGDEMLHAQRETRTQIQEANGLFK